MALSPVIEKLSLVAPFGVCFHDAATGERIADGLRVEAYPRGANPYPRRAALASNRSGVFVLRRADGLENFPFGAGDADFWAENPPVKDFVVEVADAQNRFLPFRFTARLPVKGLYRWESVPAVSPGRTTASIPLYSAPARPVPGGMAVVRADLREAVDRPARFAVLEARFRGALVARGLADREGRLALVFPALAPDTDPIASPPASASRVALESQRWSLDLTVKYQPSIFLASPPAAAEPDAVAPPDLRLALAQGAGRLWADDGRTEELAAAVLAWGRELILRARRAGVASPPTGAAFAPYLLVSPAP